MDTEKERWAYSILHSAETIERAKAPVDFYNRTLNRIKTEATFATGSVFKIAASVLLLVSLNLSVLFSTYHPEKIQQQALQAFASEYSLTGNYYYNY